LPAPRDTVHVTFSVLVPEEETVPESLVQVTEFTETQFPVSEQTYEELAVLVTVIALTGELAVPGSVSSDIVALNETLVVVVGEMYK
jgi:hypothetical protein